MVGAVMTAVVLAASVSAAQAANAIWTTPGCNANALPANDDVVTDELSLGFEVEMGNDLYGGLRISNNGYVWFGPTNLLWWQLRAWESFNVPLIAAFHADVDTRAPGSNVMRYGFIQVNGRRALCVNWINVGYFDAQENRLNSFQLILVDRNDRGAGGVDVYLNYDAVDWESGSTGSSDGRGGSLPPRVGIYNGTTADELPGSNEISMLYDGAPQALTASSRIEPAAGSYLFQLAGGAPLQSAVVTGVVTDGNGVSVAGAVVSACAACFGFPQSCVSATTNAQGQYRLTGFDSSIIMGGCASWRVRVSPPSATFLQTDIFVGIASPTQVVTGANIVLDRPAYVPVGTTLVPSRGGLGTVPTVYWNDPLTLSTRGCSVLGAPTFGASYEIKIGTVTVGSGTMTEIIPAPPAPLPNYTATVPPLSPNHGLATVTMTLRCLDGSTGTSSFDMYIDPSGWVRDTRGEPLIGATVTLLRSSYPLGPFEIVPDESPLMSPKNRNNPDFTDGAGHFGWDTVPGYYVVRAEYEGCVAPEDLSRTYVETEVLPVPPEWLDLQLTLDCEGIRPPELTLPANLQVAATSAAGAAVSYEATAYDGRDGELAVSCTSPSGGQFPLGTTEVQCSATDSSGNTAFGSFAVTVAYQWSDVLWPLSPGGANRLPRGLIVPVMFELRGGSAGIRTLQASLHVARVIGGVPGPEEPARPMWPLRSSRFFYERLSGRYLFNWATLGLAKGQYRLRIELGDGVAHTVAVELR